MTTHPVLIGLINAVIPGLGYLLIKERLVFGWLVLAATVTGFALTFVDPAWSVMLFSTTAPGQALECLLYALALLAFGYDGYDLAKKKVVVVTPSPVQTF